MNDAPVAVAQSVSTDEDTAKAIVLAGTDVEGAGITFTLLTQPVNGRLTGSAPNLIYTPNSNFNGRDSFQFRVNDGFADSASSTITIEVLPENDAPVFAAVADQVVESGKAIALTLLATDIDAPAQALVFRLKSGPSGMTVSSEGKLYWLPRSAQRPSVQRVLVEVSDGIASTESSFSVEAKAAQLVSVFNGVAIDGYISGAQVWFDADLDGVRDSNEPITTTDRTGNFNLDFDSSLFDSNGNGRLEASEGRIVVEGGIDLSSGQPRSGQLTAPLGSTVITPLTTMVDLISRQGAGISVTQAEEKVRTALGLPLGVSLTTFDPIEAAVRGDAQAATVQVASASIADTISLLASVINGASSSVDAQKANDAVTATLAARIASSATFDFGSSAMLQETINAAANSVAVAISPEVKAAVSLVVSEQNAAKQEAVANSWNPLEALNAISQVQAVAQGETAGVLSRLGAGTISVDEVQILYTGDALDQAISAAPVGDVTATNLQPGVFEFSDSSSVVVEGGRVVQPLLVHRKGGSYGSVQVVIRFTGAEGILRRESLLLDFADGVTQLPIDLSTLPIDDSLPHTDRIVSAELALGAGFPSGTAVGNFRRSSVRVIDNDSVGSIGFTASSYRGTEGSPVLVELERLNGSSGRIFAQIRLSGSSAQSGADFSAATIPIVFESGQSRVIANLGWLDDGVQESTETVNLSLELLPASDPGAALLASQGNAVVSVEDKWVAQPSNQAPIALGMAEGAVLTVVEGQTLNLTLQGRDPEGSVITFIRVGSPTKGVLSGKPPSLVYTANLGQQGEDVFSFKVNDGQSDSQVSTIRITVETANLAPLALAQVLTTEAATPLGLRLTGTDPEGDPISYRVTGLPSEGVLSGKAPDLVYSPRIGFSGLDKLEFVANDGRKDSKSQTIWLVVSQPNAAPKASDQRLEFQEDTVGTIALSGSDPEGVPLTYQVLSAPSNGKLTGAAPAMTYTPNADYSGPDSLTFRVSDGVRFSEVALVSWVVSPVNDAPIATEQRIVFTNGIPRQITLTGKDVDGDSLTYRVVVPPQRGTLIGAAPAITYLPAAGTLGDDSFTFEVNDGKVKSALAKVSMIASTINQSPTANGMTVNVVEDQPVSVKLSADDPDGTPLSYEIITAPTRGKLTGTMPNLTYTPNTNLTGLDRIVFRVSDGQLFSAAAEIFILVSPVNDAPILTPIADVVTDAGKRWATTISAFDVDVPVQPLSFSLLAGPVGMKIDGLGNLDWTPTVQQVGEHWVEASVSDGIAASSIRFKVLVEPVNTAPQMPAFAVRRVSEGNTVSFLLSATDKDQPAQSLTFGLVGGPEGLTVSSSGLLTWKPSEAQGGSSNLVVVKVSDNGKPSLSATNTIEIIVREINQPPVLTDFGSVTVDALKGWTQKLSANDADIPSQTLTYRLVRGPQGLTLSTNGVIEWTPNLAQAGSHVLEVAVDDGVVSVSQVATVTVEVVNTAPVVNSVGTRRVAEGNLLSFQLTATDAELAIQRLTFGLVSGPLGLTVSSNGLVAWRPSEAQGPSTNILSVRVTDDGQPSMSHTNSIEIIVREVNKAPLTLAVTTRRVSEGNILTFPLNASDADLPLQRLSFSVAAGPVGLTVSSNGVVKWSPGEDQGPSTNLVQILVGDDGSPSLSATNWVEIIVREVNSAPVFSVIGPKAVQPDANWSFQLAAVDSDIPIQILKYRLVTGPAGLTVTTNGLVQWKPAVSELGKSLVTVEVSDGVSTTQEIFPITVATEIAPRLEMAIGNDSAPVLRIYGLAGFRYQIETSENTLGAWSLLDQASGIETLGYTTPVELPLGSVTGNLRFFRIRSVQP